MIYKSLFDLNADIATNFHRLPGTFDLVVGVPRSGLLAANLLSLLTNLPMADLDTYLSGKTLSSGKTKRQDSLAKTFNDIKRVLILDDSINVGTAMKSAREAVMERGFGHEYVFAAVYGRDPEHDGCDFIFEVVPQPRCFQWNIMHHNVLTRACVDIDGVLCLDPTQDQNDDGKRYLEFLLSAPALHLPTKRIARLVTSRLEKYRPQTERWLADHAVEYDELIMLDLPSKEERQRLKVHGSFKASVYSQCDAQLFIESEVEQARSIALISDKPVLCLENHVLYDRRNVHLHEAFNRSINMKANLATPSLITRMKWASRRIVGSRIYDSLKHRLLT